MVSKQLAAVLTILGGVFYIVGSLVGVIASAGFLYGLLGLSSLVNPARGFNGGGIVNIVIAILILGIFAGVLIITGGGLNSDQAPRRKSGGILALSMMIIGALPALGGLGIGFIFTLVGAVLGLTYSGPPEMKIVHEVVRPEMSMSKPTQGVIVKYCIECGAPLPQNAKFCQSCGTQVVRP